MDDPLSTRLRKQDLAAKSERARSLRMKNDEAEGSSLARTSSTGNRVVAEFDAAMTATIAAVLGALEGE